MAKNYSVDITGQITTVRFSRAPGVDDVRAALDEVFERSPSRLRLWDLTCGVDLPPEQVRELAEHGKSLTSPVAKVAVVATEDLTYGLSRMYGIFREEEHVEFRVFRTEQEARAWLGEHAGQD